MALPLPENESDRLHSLEGYHILDTPPEQAFDDITVLAAFICSTPIALLTLLDTTRQWFKSAVGLAIKETTREVAFCSHALAQPEILIIHDALADVRFAKNPLVTGEPHIRFYAGVQLITTDGYPLGTLCVIDQTPRVLSPQQVAALQALARQTITQLELRRVSIMLEQANQTQATLISDLEGALGRIKTLEGIIPICAHCKNIRDDKGYWQQVEIYLHNHSNADFSHGMCPACMHKFYPDFYEPLLP